MVWIPPEADSRKRIQVQTVYLSGPRECYWECREVIKEGRQQKMCQWANYHEVHLILLKKPRKWNGKYVLESSFLFIPQKAKELGYLYPNFLESLVDCCLGDSVFIRIFILLLTKQPPTPIARWGRKMQMRAIEVSQVEQLDIPTQAIWLGA